MKLNYDSRFGFRLRFDNTLSYLSNCTVSASELLVLLAMEGLRFAYCQWEDLGSPYWREGAGSACFRQGNLGSVGDSEFRVLPVVVTGFCVFLWESLGSVASGRIRVLRIPAEVTGFCVPVVVTRFVLPSGGTAFRCQWEDLGSPYWREGAGSACFQREGLCSGHLLRRRPAGEGGPHDAASAVTAACSTYAVSHHTQ